MRAFCRALVTAILCLLILDCASQSPLHGSGKSIDFYFVQISDPHLGDSINNIRTDSIVRSVNRLSIQPSLSLVTGDMVYDPNNEQWTKTALQLFGKLTKPFVFIPGNHDVWYKPDNTTTQRYRQVFGSTDTTFVLNGVRWVCFNSNWTTKSQNLQTDSVMVWLAKALTCDRLPKIVVTHIPPVPDFHHNAIHPGWLPQYQSMIDSLINIPNANIQAMLCGHFHRSELHWLGPVPVYIAPPVSRSLGRQAQYRLYRYKDGKLSYHTIFLE